MKFSRIVISLIISALLFMFSLRSYDNIVGPNLYKTTHFYHETGLTIHSSHGFDEQYIIDTLIELANKNMITLRVAYGDSKNQIYFLHSQDPDVIDSYILYGDKRIDYNSETHYSNTEKDKSKRIFKPNAVPTLDIYTLTAYKQFDFNIKGEYAILAKDKESQHAFISGVKEKLSDYELKFIPVGDAEEVILLDYSFETKDLLLLISLEILLAMSIVFIVIRNTKKISILRLEGHSTLKIYLKLIGMPVLFSFLLIPLIFSSLFLIFFLLYTRYTNTLT